MVNPLNAVLLDVEAPQLTQALEALKGVDAIAFKEQGPQALRKETRKCTEFGQNKCWSITEAKTCEFPFLLQLSCMWTSCS